MISGTLNLLQTAGAVSAATGKSTVKQLFEALSLRLGNTRLGISEYYKFGLYDDERWSAAEKREVVGWRQEAYYTKKLNARPWNVLTGDKLVGYGVLAGMAFPIPRIYAVFHPFGRSFPGAKTLTNEQDLTAYLRQEIPYPFFSKPAHGALGQNSVAVERYDPGSDSLVLSSGKILPVTEYVKSCYPFADSWPWHAGFIFQERLEPEPDLARTSGSTVSSMRMICMNPDRTPELFRVVWKVPVGDNMTDNFHHGTSGNLIASIDTQTGQVQRVVGGTGLQYREVPEHPDTGKRLLDITIPDWPEYAELCRKATGALPGVRLQHWDIAITDRGPVILELNTFGDYDLPQIAYGKGFLDQKFKTFVKELGDKYTAYEGPGGY